MTKHHYRHATERDLPALIDMLRWSFRLSAENADRWIANSGIDAVRLVTVDRNVAACLIVKRMGIFLGGASVSTAGIAAVATAPELRGRGVGRFLLERCLEEVASDGVATAVLYPSTRSVYRRVGFGVAGVRYTYQLALGDLGRQRSELSSRLVTAADVPQVRALYRAAALRKTGMLDRDDYYWSRLTDQTKRQVKGFVFEADTIEAYLYLYMTQGSGESFRYDVRVTDYGFSTARGLMAISGMLAAHSSMGEHVAWDGGPSDAIINTVDTASYTTRQSPSHWMLRVLNPRQALRERGYPSNVNGQLMFEVADATLPANAGRYCLTLANGKASVVDGGSGDFKINVEDLASLLTGHISARALMQTERLAATPEQMVLAEQAFGGPAPWMREAF